MCPRCIQQPFTGSGYSANICWMSSDPISGVWGEGKELTHTAWGAGDRGMAKTPGARGRCLPTRQVLGGVFSGHRRGPAPLGSENRKHGRKVRRASRRLTHGVWRQQAADQPSDPRQTRSASWGPAQRVPTPSWASPRSRPKVVKWQVLLLQRARGPGASPRRSPCLLSRQSVPPLCDTALGAHRPQLTEGGSEALEARCCCRAGTGSQEGTRSGLL